jgi:hypothetical protein
MNDPAYAARMNSLIDRALAGSDTIRGYTDQGSAGDPNYTRGGVGVNINRERFNDWGYPGARAWREQRERELAADRGSIDAKSAQSVRVEGSGTLTAKITAPEGTETSMRGAGLFKQVEIERVVQMSPARSGPTTLISEEKAP